MQLHITENLQDKMIDFEVEATVPLQDVFVVFYSNPTECGLRNGAYSAPYVQYFFKKVTHICHCRKKTEGQLYSVMIGFYFDGNESKPFVITENTDAVYNRFGTDEMHGEQIYSNYRLFNYKEYVEVAEMLGQEKLSFDKYIEKIISRGMGHEYYTLFDTKPNKEGSIDFKRLINHDALNKWFDKQEIPGPAKL